MDRIEEMKSKLPDGYIMLNIKPCKVFDKNLALESAHYVWVTCVVNHEDIKENVYDKLNYRFVSDEWYDGVGNGFIYDKKYIVVGNGVPYEKRLFNKLNIETRQLEYDKFLTFDEITEKEGKSIIL